MFLCLLESYMEEPKVRLTEEELKGKFNFDKLIALAAKIQQEKVIKANKFLEELKKTQKRDLLG